MPRPSASRAIFTAAIALSLAPRPAVAFSTSSFAKAIFGRFVGRAVVSSSRDFCTMSTVDVSQTYDELAAKLRRTAHLEGITGLLGWDQQTMMPSGAEAARGAQLAALAGVIHDSKTDPAIGELIKLLEPHSTSLPPFKAANLRIASEGFVRNQRMSSELASRAAELESRAYGAWTRAREESNFEVFAPMLKEVFELQKEICSVTKPDMEIYDAAIDSYDPKMKADRITEIFDKVKSELTPLINEIAAKVANDPYLHEIPEPLRGGPNWDSKKQEEMCKEIAEAIGFDFAKGRMDVSVHPFTGGSHVTDVRITTRYSNSNWIEGVAGTIHECGHAMYEQGRPSEHSDLPVSQALGMATHESQSLLWERMVGQSLSFWKWATPIVHRYFPHTKSCTPEDFYRVINIVKPSLIRVDADEVTYPLHVILRFEIERGVLVDDLPNLWNDKMLKYLGIIPPSNKEGVLQDVHWPSGAVGYFPSYTLGAMMATQIFEHACKDMPSLESKIEAGDFKPLLLWLNEKVHSQGSLHESADDLLLAVTGKRLDPSIFVEYLRKKYTTIYGL